MQGRSYVGVAYSLSCIATHNHAEAHPQGRCPLPSCNVHTNPSCIYARDSIVSSPSPMYICDYILPLCKCSIYYSCHFTCLSWITKFSLLFTTTMCFSLMDRLAYLESNNKDWWIHHRHLIPAESRTRTWVTGWAIMLWTMKIKAAYSDQIFI